MQVAMNPSARAEPARALDTEACMISLVRDIREREHLEKALRERVAEFDRAQSVAKIGNWRLDICRNELRWSDETHRIFGVPIGIPMNYEAFLACVHPDDRTYVDQQWKAALTGNPYDIEHRVVVDGKIKWVREKAELEFDNTGVLLGGFGTAQDITDRKRLQEELRLAEAKASGILAISADAIISIDDHQRITMFNEGAEKIFGYSRDEVLGASHDILLPKRFRERHRRDIEAFASGKDVARRMGERSAEIVGLRKNGEEFPADASISKLDLNGVKIFTVALRDITAQKRAEQQIRQAHERIELALKGADLAAWDWNIETGEVIFSPRWAEMRGYRPEEVEPHLNSWIRDVHPDDWPRVQKTLDDYLHGVIPEYESEYRMRTKSGDWIWIFVRGKAFARDEHGKPTRMVGTELDLTMRKRIEWEQRVLAQVGSVFASTLDYEDTLSNIAQLVAREMADFCIIYGLDGAEVRRRKVVSRNPALEWICQELAKAPLDGTDQHPVRLALDTLQPVLLEHVSLEMVGSFSEKQELVRLLEIIDPKSILAVPLQAHGKLLGAMGFFSTDPFREYGKADIPLAEDIAHRAALAIDNSRLYREARRAIGTRDDILGVVAHDLRNPLGTILMQVARLRRRESAADVRWSSAIDAIERTVARMNRLIEDLLDVTRMEAGGLSIQPCAIATAEFLADVIQSQKSLASAASLELLPDVAPHLPEALADRDRLLQVFENLIGNAIKFTSPSGRITVGAASREWEVLFWVADTGAGIAAEVLPHVFDRFWQAGKAGQCGAGLGLAIVKGIVEAHGGRVWVESTEGRGSTFFFTIPMALRA
jgi:PAS domain S-box-containing protein